MSLDADLDRLSLSGCKKTSDPVSDATKKGRIPTLGEVKRSLKSLIKNLIQATTQMDVLPKRRFATFKLFYYDHTPDDYEPTHFRAGDVKKDRWFFTTHDQGEVPEKCSIGSLQTGYHGIDVRVASVSGYLPSAEDNSAPFVGTTNGHVHPVPPLTPAEEATLRAQQVEIQRQDALDRRVVWDADEGLCDADAEGDDDPEYSSGPDDNGESLECWRVDDSGVEFCIPIGLRDDEGQVKPFSKNYAAVGQHRITQGALYTGKLDTVPIRIAQLAVNGVPEDQIQQTQRLEQTQIIDSPVAGQVLVPSSPPCSPPPSPTPKARNSKSTSKQPQPASGSLPPSDIDPASLFSSAEHGEESIDTQTVKEFIEKACITGNQDSQVLDIDTQMIPDTLSPEDPIQSFTSAKDVVCQGSPMAQCSHQDKEAQLDDIALACECGVATEDCDCCMCEGGCQKWFHLWCMGYHSAKDKRIPEKFICFDCRVRADQNWDLIMVHDLYPRMMERFRDLAIMRRAIKIFEIGKPDSLSAFTKSIGCDSVVAGQLFKRLEVEGFIGLESVDIDDVGLMETTTRTTKSKGKGKATRTKQPRRKAMRKPKYVFIGGCISSQAYKDYFNPQPEVEKKLLGLSNLKPDRKSRKRLIDDMDIEMYNSSAQAILLLIKSGFRETVHPDGIAAIEGTSMDIAPKADALGITRTGSQTQEETQLVALRASQDVSDAAASDTRRRATRTSGEEAARPNKKVKMSLGPAVDLGD